MDIGRYLDNMDKKFTRKETTKMKQYDYLIVGSGLYGAVFAQQATAKGKKVLVIDKRPNIAGNVYTEDIEKIHVHKYGATETASGFCILSAFHVYRKNR